MIREDLKLKIMIVRKMNIMMMINMWMMKKIIKGNDCDMYLIDLIMIYLGD